MLPISVLLPTRNSMSLLPKHIEGMRSWVDLADEVIAVDSHSNDGTLQLLQRELKHPKTHVLTHPPGLYQSWNFGITQCRAKYIYISTAGETITGEGISQLVATAERFAADVVISPPRMIDMTGRAKEKEWPVHALISALELHAPVAMEGAAAQVFAVTHMLRGILGSSASNLYRAPLLQRFPFRTDFGTAGDLAWGLEHAGEVRLAIIPRSFSTFLFHPKSYAKSDYAVADLAEKCARVAAESVAKKSWASAGNVNVPETEALLTGLMAAWQEFLAARRAVQEHKSKAGWFLRPRAWSAHAERGEKSQRLRQAQAEAMKWIAPLVVRGD
jgi:glycosyltransferase involved in cell wall biosynthesis